MRLPRFLLALGLAATPVALAAQAAVDPAVAPRAVALDRAGRRVEAMEMLGRYLAASSGAVAR